MGNFRGGPRSGLIILVTTIFPPQKGHFSTSIPFVISNTSLRVNFFFSPGGSHLRLFLALARSDVLLREERIPYFRIFIKRFGRKCCTKSSINFITLTVFVFILLLSALSVYEKVTMPLSIDFILLFAIATRCMYRPGML